MLVNKIVGDCRICQLIIITNVTIHSQRGQVSLLDL